MFKLNVRMLEMLMQTNNLSQNELSLRSGVSKSVISRILGGHTSKPNAETVRAICRYFNVPLSDLIWQDGGKPARASSVQENLRALMLHASITSAADLCRKSGIPALKIERILNGTTSVPHVATLNDLANFFHVSVAQLKGRDPMPPLTKGGLGIGRSSLPLLALSEVETWVSGKGVVEDARHYIETDSHAMGEQSFAIQINTDDYSPYFRKGSVLMVDSKMLPAEGDYFVGRALSTGTAIYEFLPEASWFIRQVCSQECVDVLGAGVQLFGVVVEIKLK